MLIIKIVLVTLIFMPEVSKAEDTSMSNRDTLYSGAIQIPVQFHGIQNPTIETSLFVSRGAEQGDTSYSSNSTGAGLAALYPFKASETLKMGLGIYLSTKRSRVVSTNEFDTTVNSYRPFVSLFVNNNIALGVMISRNERSWSTTSIKRKKATEYYSVLYYQPTFDLGLEYWGKKSDVASTAGSEYVNGGTSLVYRRVFGSSKVGGYVLVFDTDEAEFQSLNSKDKIIYALTYEYVCSESQKLALLLRNDTKVSSFGDGASMSLDYMIAANESILVTPFLSLAYNKLNQSTYRYLGVGVQLQKRF